MAKQIQKWIDDRGNEFDTEAAAEASNELTKNEGSIEAYIDAFALAKGQAGWVRRVIPEYLAFTNSEDFQDRVIAANEKLRAARAEAEALPEPEAKA